MKLSFYIDRTNYKMKIDKILVDKIHNISRKKIRRLLDSGNVFVNDKVKTYSSTVLKVGDKIQVHNFDEIEQPDTYASIEDLILYEDKESLVVNKLPGLTCDQGSKKSNSVTSFFEKGLIKERGLKSINLYLCHRLDKDTSGALILAKNHGSRDWYINQFRTRSIKKTYIAICHHFPEKKNWQLENYLSKISPIDRRVKVLATGGNQAITKFRKISHNTIKKVSLIQCIPVTGRSHQIRFHLCQSSIPILGDLTYSKDLKLARSSGVRTHCLHAQKIEFTPYKKTKSHSVKAFFLMNMTQVAKNLKIHLNDI